MNTKTWMWKCVLRSKMPSRPILRSMARCFSAIFGSVSLLLPCGWQGGCRCGESQVKGVAHQVEHGGVEIVLARNRRPTTRRWPGCSRSRATPCLNLDIGRPRCRHLGKNRLPRANRAVDEFAGNGDPPLTELFGKLGLGLRSRSTRFQLGAGLSSWYREIGLDASHRPFRP